MCNTMFFFKKIYKIHFLFYIFYIEKLGTVRQLKYKNNNINEVIEYGNGILLYIFFFKKYKKTENKFFVLFIYYFF